MNFTYISVLLIIIANCFAGPLEDISNMPDLTLFYQQLMRQQDIQMLLQGIYAQQPFGTMTDFTIFAPHNDAMMQLNRKNEDPNLLWKYHIIQGRFDSQTLYDMAQAKLNQANPKQIIDVRPQNNLPTLAVPFQVFYGLGYYGGIGSHINESVDNAGYGLGGISWLTHTSLNQTNLFDNNMPQNPNFGNTYKYNQNQFANQGGYPSNNRNPNLQHAQNPATPNTYYNPYLKQANYGPVGPAGILQPTINNAFILQTRPMSRGIIHVIDQILWPPERRDQTQYKTAYDALEDRQFSRVRQLAERSDFFRSELRSKHHQTWFLPTDQAFASMGSSLSFLFDQLQGNNNQDINEFIKVHAVPLVLYPNSMDSTKHVTTLSDSKWVTFRKVAQPDYSFQVDVICGRHTARILINRPEDIRLYGNGIVYPVSTILSTQVRSAADELTRSYPYFMNLIQQSGDLELINLLHGTSNTNLFNSQSVYNITVLVPQQTSIQQLGTSQELSMHLRRHILRVPLYTDESFVTPNVFTQPNIYQTGQVQSQQPMVPQPQQPMVPQPQQPMVPQPQQPMVPQPQQPMVPQPQQPMVPQYQQPIAPQYQQPMVPQTQQPMIPQSQQPMVPQHQPPFMSNGFNQQPYSMPQFQQTVPRSDKKESRYRRQMNIPVSNTNFQRQQYSQHQSLSQQPQSAQQQQQQQQQSPSNQRMFSLQQQQMQPPLPNQQMLPIQQQQSLSNPPILPMQQQQQQQPPPNQQILPIQQQQPPNQQILSIPPQQQPISQSFYPSPSYPSLTLFQHGQIYPTMDPQFSVQAQISSGPSGNIVTLVGRSAGSLPFAATILNSESNTLIKNGVIHAIRGVVSGMVIPIQGILASLQGTTAFTQLLHQTGIMEQLKQSGRAYTLFIPTNAALQSMGTTKNPHQLRHFVLRHICADVLLDPTSNVLRRSAGFYNRDPNYRKNPQQQSSRHKRQNWVTYRINDTKSVNRQGMPSLPYNSNVMQNQMQQSFYGDFPSIPPSFNPNNQMMNSGSGPNSYTPSNSPYFPTNNYTYPNNPSSTFNNPGGASQPMSNNNWNETKFVPFNSPMNIMPNNEPQNVYSIINDPPTGSTYTSGPQSCTAMTGERITVQPLAGTQPGFNTPSMSYQNFIITCCSDQSVNSMVQLYNVYSPNFAVYLIGRPLLSQGQTINTLYNHAIKPMSSYNIFIFFITSITLKQMIPQL